MQKDKAFEIIKELRRRLKQHTDVLGQYQLSFVRQSAAAQKQSDRITKAQEELGREPRYVTIGYHLEDDNISDMYLYNNIIELGYDGEVFDDFATEFGLYFVWEGSHYFAPQIIFDKQLYDNHIERCTYNNEYLIKELKEFGLKGRELVDEERFEVTTYFNQELLKEKQQQFKDYEYGKLAKEFKVSPDLFSRLYRGWTREEIIDNVKDFHERYASKMKALLDEGYSYIGNTTETRKFLKKEFKNWLSTNVNGKIRKYIDEESWVEERMVPLDTEYIYPSVYLVKTNID